MPISKTAHKDELRSKILHTYAISPSTRSLILLDIQDREICSFLREAGESIGIDYILSEAIEDKTILAGFDALVSDQLSGSIDIPFCVSSGVVPILPLDNPFPKTFQEFDPMKFEGNAFLFKEINQYLIFEKIIRYLENIRYAGDKRTLLQNVKKTF